MLIDPSPSQFLSWSGKTIVQGILDRDLRAIRAKAVPNVKRETLQNEVLNNVKYGSTAYKDDAVGYLIKENREDNKKRA